MPPYDRAALRRAVRARNVERLEAALATVKESGLSEELAIEVREARRLLMILKRMMGVKVSLQELKQTMLAELVNQTSPNNIMVTIMKAVMIVLDVPEEELGSWSQIQAQIGTLPRKHYSFIKRLANINTGAVKG